MLFAIEGIDVSGKQTQVSLPAERYHLAGLRNAALSFPRNANIYFGASFAIFTHQQTHIGSQA